jgi:hypothetical protein
MKKSLLIITVALIGIVVSCKKNKVEKHEYIPECAYINAGTSSSMIERNNICQNCCKTNGWETGTYWEQGAQTGCECMDKP